MIDLRKEACALMIVDLQGKLFKMMEEYEEIIYVTNVMLEVADKMDIPLLVTEQYSKGLGVTDERIKLPSKENYTYMDKTTFTCFSGEIEEKLWELQKKYVLIVGTETHVCVWQTARDLLKHGFIPVVLEDGVASRDSKNKKNALRSIKQLGGYVLNMETVLFDLLKDSKDPNFKFLSKLLK